MARELGTFLWEFIRNPLRTGGLMPSSPSLAAEIAAPIPPTGKPLVVELGAGTGAFTETIQRILDGHGRHIAVELNTRFARALQDRFPAVDVVNADAAGLPDLVRSRGFEHADLIVSGLPWASFSPGLQDTLLNAVTAALARHGTFTTFAYVHALRMPPAKRFRAKLDGAFGEVRQGHTVWRNVPPALVYAARGPRSAKA